MLAYKLSGMTWFQAINHMMTTVSTGGFSTEAMSIEQFQSPLLEWVCILFMVLGGTTFIFVINLLRLRKNKLRERDEVVCFLGILVVSSLLLTLYLVEQTGELPSHGSFRAAVFQAVSIMTTTGYSSTNFDTWLPAAKITLLILMLIGSCSGSTTGGIKVVRIMIATRAALNSIIMAFRPNLTRPIRMNGRVLSESNIHSVIVFVTLNIVIIIVSTLYVSSIEASITPIETFSCVQATLFNIGPGFGSFGPTQNFEFLHSFTKVYLSLLMVLGRLELYAVLVLFHPKVWEQYS